MGAEPARGALVTAAGIGLGPALAVLGVVVLLALALHGWWSTRRARPRTAPASMLPPERVEPPLGAEPQAPLAQIDPDADADAAAAPPRTGPRRAARLDALIDAIVPLALDAPISGEFALQHLPPSRRAGSKPFLVEGLDTETGDWAALTPGRRYGELQAGVQMANRSGALNEIEFSEFVQKIEAYAEAVGARADLPDMLEVVARARELDALAGPLDAQLTVTLRSTGVAWSVGYVQQVAGRLGLVPGAVPGRLVLPAADEGAPPVLVLAMDTQAALEDTPQAAIRECTLILDVPQTAAAVEPFPAWHQLATRLAEDLGAVATDDRGQPITLHAYAAIGRELDALYARLEALDLAAGSAAARRLFG